MEYLVKKRIGATFALIAVFTLTALVFLFLNLFKYGIYSFNLSAALLLVFIVLLTVKRFILSGYLYRLSDEYPKRLDFFIIHSKKVSSRLGSVEFTGDERIVPCTRKRKKELKNIRVSGNLVSNLIPKDKYALIYSDDRGECLVYIEAESFFISRLEKEIASVKRNSSL